MKKIIFALLLLLILPFNILASNTAIAKEIIDQNKSSSLSLNYKYDDIKINNVNVKIYKVADMGTNFRYTLTSDFSSYPITINGIDNKDDWNTISNTLCSYVYSDKINYTKSNIINNNKVKFNNLTPGLYLVITDVIDEKKFILEFDSFLINLPSVNENGILNYDVTAQPKPSYYEPKYEDVSYSVIKEWKDTGKDRPESIDIIIYMNGEEYENVTLSSENNWSYSWNHLDDGTKFSVIEKNVPKDYTVSIEKNERKYIIVNTKNEDNPKTLDNIYIYFILFIGSFVGMLISVFAFRNNDIKNQ